MKLRALFVVVALLHLVPVWRVPLIPTVDGPSHVYNAVVLRELAAGTPEFTRVFKADLRPHPNWLTHAMLFVLVYVVPPIVAEKIVFSIIVLVFLAGLWTLAGLLDERGRVWAFLAMPLAFHLLLQMGFYNYSMGVSLVPFAIAAAWRGRRVATTILLTLLYFTHALPAALAMLMVALIALRRRAWRDLLTLIPAALFFAWFATQPSPGGEWTWAGAFAWQPFVRMAVLMTVGTALAIAYAAAIIFTLARERRDPTFAVLALVATILYFVAPIGVQEGFVLKARLLIFPFLLILPWLTPRVAVLPLAIVLSLVALANVVLIRTQWKRNAAVMEESIAVFENIQPKRTLIPLLADRSTGHSTLPLLSHAVSYAAATNRLVDLSNYEAGLGFFPVAFREGLNRPSIFEMETAPQSFDAARYGVDLIYQWKMPAPPPPPYELIVSGGEARLFER